MHFDIRMFLQMDPSLELYRKELVMESGRKLDKARMIRFEERTGYFASTDLGRTASHFYIKYNTIEVKMLKSYMGNPNTFRDIEEREMWRYNRRKIGNYYIQVDGKTVNVVCNLFSSKDFAVTYNNEQHIFAFPFSPEDFQREF